MDKEYLDKCLVVNFCTNERTEKLSDLCFQKLGFENRITLKSDTGFHEKFLEFAKIAASSDYEYFIRNDADRLVFKGIFDVFDIMIQDENISWITGVYFDYIMDRFRGGTPSIIKKECLSYLVDNPSLMKDIQKPEAGLCNAIDDKFKIVDVKIFTNLHEYDQYPSKVCNAFLNRLGRNHYPRLYNNNYLNSLPQHYLNSIKNAFEYFSKQGYKNSMVFEDFSYLDKQFTCIADEQLEEYYKKYLRLYNELSKQYT